MTNHRRLRGVYRKQTKNRKRATFLKETATAYIDEDTKAMLWQTARGAWVKDELDNDEDMQEITLQQAKQWLHAQGYDLDMIYLEDQNDRLIMSLGMKYKTRLMQAAKREGLSINAYAERILTAAITKSEEDQQKAHKRIYNVFGSLFKPSE